LFLLAKWQVSWLLPGSASSQGDAPVTFGALHAEGNYSSGHCSGLAPDSLSTQPHIEASVSPNALQRYKEMLKVKNK